jgi:hypothetical protein
MKEPEASLEQPIPKQEVIIYLKRWIRPSTFMRAGVPETEKDATRGINNVL